MILKHEAMDLWSPGVLWEARISLGWRGRRKGQTGQCTFHEQRHEAAALHRIDDHHIGNDDASSRRPLYRWNLLATVVGLVLILTEIGDQRVLGEHLLLADATSISCGMALTIIGLTFAVWARRRLGIYWASRIELKEAHRLIQNGPYRIIRHPIYAGIVVAALGSVIVDADLDGVFGSVLIAGSFFLKLRREERFMPEAFDDDWLAWRTRTWVMIPYLY
ncbi:MAG TPA: isoprenylcysteine carboxylmethyltransferase family protein [Magnetospirillaceae bacterium]|jgi:protein-S-isoprenylcysteine O-methyltransferase Ste14